MTERKHAWALRALMLSVLGLSAEHVQAQGIIRDSHAAISSGRGGTNIAFSDNLTLILDNPAGLVNMPEFERIDFGFDTLVTSLHYSDLDGEGHARTVPFPLPQLSYMRKSEDGRFAYGIGAFAPAGFGAHYTQNHWLYGKREYSSMGGLIKILPAAAYKVTDDLSIGGTLGLGISHIDLEAPFALQKFPFSGVPLTLDLQARGLAMVWSFGLQYDLSEQTRLGLVYRGETRFKLDGDARGDVSGVGIPFLKADYDAEVDLVWPRNAGLGILHRFNERHRAAFDVLWFDWSDSFDSLDMKLTDGSNPLFDLILGPTVRDSIPLDWDDGFAFKVGYEFDVTPQDTIRMGYVYHENPIPNATLMPLLIGTLEHAVTVGYGHKWDRWRLDVAYQYSWGSVNEVGISKIAGGDYNFSSSHAQAHWFIVTFSFSF